MPKKELITSLLKFGGWVTISTAVAPFLLTIDRLVIGAILGAAAVAAYSIPFSLIARMAIIPGSLSSALFPRFASSDDEECQRLMGISVSAIAVTMTPAAIAAMLLVEPFFRLWLGSELAAASTPIAYVLLPGIWINSFAQVPYSLLQGSGRPDVVSKLLIAEIFPYWMVLLAGVWWFGVIGAAAAWSLRVGADAILLFWSSGLRLRGLRVLVVPAVLLIVSFLCAITLEGPLRMAAIAAVLAASLGWSALTLPEPLRQKVRWMALSLRLRQSEAGAE